MSNVEYLKSLSVDELARFNVKDFVYMSGYRVAGLYRTSNYSEFDTKEEAIEYEKKWLLSKVDKDTFEYQ